MNYRHDERVHKPLGELELLILKDESREVIQCEALWPEVAGIGTRLRTERCQDYPHKWEDPHYAKHQQHDLDNYIDCSLLSVVGV